MNFNEILKELRKSGNITQKKLSQDLGYSQSVICEWEKGTTQPTAAAIILLAQYFKVSTDYLLGCENDFGIKNNQSPTEQTYSLDEKQLIETYRTLSPGKKKALFDMLDIEQPKKQIKDTRGN